MAVTFHTTVIQAEGKQATGLVIPAEVVTALGSHKRPPVVVTIAGYSYRSTIANYGETFLLPLAAEHRTAAGVKAGDPVEVTLELDTAPRLVEVPDDLAAALAAVPGAREAFDKLSTSVRKEHARQVTSAKAEETRQRRIAAVVAKVTGG